MEADSYNISPPSVYSCDCVINQPVWFIYQYLHLDAHFKHYIIAGRELDKLQPGVILKHLKNFSLDQIKVLIKKFAGIRDARDIISNALFDCNDDVIEYVLKTLSDDVSLTPEYLGDKDVTKLKRWAQHVKINYYNVRLLDRNCFNLLRYLWRTCDCNILSLIIQTHSLYFMYLDGRVSNNSSVKPQLHGLIRPSMVFNLATELDWLPLEARKWVASVLTK